MTQLTTSIAMNIGRSWLLQNVGLIRKLTSGLRRNLSNFGDAPSGSIGHDRGWLPPRARTLYLECSLVCIS
uniref:Uncharacterized protein n=1 Tax=Rhizophora mucronata TaxID=61149 RepID=A0A2P2NHB5_RHIMU